VCTGVCERWMDAGLENDTFQQWTGQWGDLSNVPSRFRRDEQSLCDLVVRLVKGELHGCGGSTVGVDGGGGSSGERGEFGNVGVIYSGTCAAPPAKGGINVSRTWGRYLTASDGSRLSVRFEPHNLFDCKLAPSQLGRFSIRRECTDSNLDSNSGRTREPPVVRTLLFFGWPHGAHAQHTDCLATVHDQQGAPTGGLGHPLSLFPRDETNLLEAGGGVRSKDQSNTAGMAALGVAGALLGVGGGGGDGDGDGGASSPCREKSREQVRHALRRRFQSAEKRALAAGHCSAAFTQAYLASSNVLLLSEPLGIMLLNTLPSLSGALPDLHTGPCGTNTVLAVAVRIAMAPSRVYWRDAGSTLSPQWRSAVLDQTKGTYEDVYARGVARVAFESTTQPLIHLELDDDADGAAPPTQEELRRGSAIYSLDILVRWLLLKARSGSSTPDAAEEELFLRLYRIGQRVVTVCFGARPFMCPTEQCATSDHISNAVDRFVRAMVYKSGSVPAGEAEAHNPLLETSVASGTDLAATLCGILRSVEAWLQTADERKTGGTGGTAEADIDDDDAAGAEFVAAFKDATGLGGPDISFLALRTGLGALCASLGVWSSGAAAPLSAKTHLVGDAMHQNCVDCKCSVHVVEAVLFAHDGTACADRSEVRCLRCARQRLGKPRA